MNKGIIKKIYRQKDIENIQEKINMMGSTRKFKFDAVEFLNLRVLTTILVIIILFYQDINYYLIPVIAILYYNLFYYILIINEINKRIKKLDKEALSFFEVLSLSLEAGRNLENSLELTCYNIDNELSSEFKKCLMETKFGKSLMESLEDLKKRIPSDTINNTILNITQTSIFGNSIIEVMNREVEFLREKQILEVKSQINKIPNKVSIVSVLFIVPLILLLILGPFIINLL